MNHVTFKVFISENSPVNWKEVMEDFQCELIAQALFLSGGCNTRAAKMLGVKRTTLVERKKALGIEWEEVSGG